MSLPILQPRDAASPADLLRLYTKAESQWVENLGEPTITDWGTIRTNPSWPLVHDANHVRDARVPPGMTAADVVRATADHFRRAGTTCHYWRTDDEALAAHLAAAGYSTDVKDAMYLRGSARAPADADADADADAGLTIIPARASYRHVRMLAEESADEVDPAAVAQLVDADQAILDDANVEGILALRNQTPVGRVYLLAVGEIGSIEHLFVSPSLRRQGVARALLARAIEACARSLFRHVFVTVRPGNTVARNLYERFGFVPVGQVVRYRPASLTTR